MTVLAVAGRLAGCRFGDGSRFFEARALEQPLKEVVQALIAKKVAALQVSTHHPHQAG